MDASKWLYCIKIMVWPGKYVFLPGFATKWLKVQQFLWNTLLKRESTDSTIWWIIMFHTKRSILVCTFLVVGCFYARKHFSTRTKSNIVTCVRPVRQQCNSAINLRLSSRRIPSYSSDSIPTTHLVKFYLPQSSWIKSDEIYW